MSLTKKLEVSNHNVDHYLELLSKSAEPTLANIKSITNTKSPLEALQLMKFNQIGYDPLDSSIKLNLIEQLNQTFTYMASFLAAKYIFEHHKSVGKIHLNLGTESGSDLESSDGSIVGEVFATTNIQNNGKLMKDIERVKAVQQAKHRYVFFIAPEIAEGPYSYKSTRIDLEDVKIISLKQLNADDAYPFVKKH